MNAEGHRQGKRARWRMPLGVSSNTRAWGEGRTLYVEKAAGAAVWDVDGNRYLDYRLAFGPVILGYAYEPVDRYVRDAIQRGLVTGLTSELEVRAVEKLAEMCPAIEMARLVSTGSEATLHAIRLARAFTGREKIVKFEGGYHGGHDQVLFSTQVTPESGGDPATWAPAPASAGLPRCLSGLIIPLPFNRPELLERTLREQAHTIAALIAEPFLGNCGSIEPLPGFLNFVQERCAHYGVLLILDEVKTGFRVARGGAQELYGLRPDLATYAKALGNGYPVAAYGGRREVMERVGRGVTQGGTYSGNGVAAAAAAATLEIIAGEPVLETIAQHGRRLQAGLRAIFRDSGWQAILSGYPAIFGITFGLEKASEAREWARSDQARYRRLAEALQRRGILVDHDPREPWCLSYSHQDEEIDQTLNTVEDAVREVSRIHA